jgi:hypothetical protein
MDRTTRRIAAVVVGTVVGSFAVLPPNGRYGRDARLGDMPPTTMHLNGQAFYGRVVYDVTLETLPMFASARALAASASALKHSCLALTDSPEGRGMIRLNPKYGYCKKILRPEQYAPFSN